MTICACCGTRKGTCFAPDTPTYKLWCALCTARYELEQAISTYAGLQARIDTLKAEIAEIEKEHNG